MGLISAYNNIDIFVIVILLFFKAKLLFLIVGLQKLNGVCIFELGLGFQNIYFLSEIFYEFWRERIKNLGGLLLLLYSHLLKILDHIKICLLDDLLHLVESIHFLDFIDMGLALHKINPLSES